MAEKLGSNSGTQVIDLSTLVGVSRDIRDYTRIGSSYLKAIDNSLGLIYSKLNKPNLGNLGLTETGTFGIRNSGANYHSSGNSGGSGLKSDASVVGETIGGVAGKLIGSAAGGPIGAVIGQTIGSLLGKTIGSGIDQEINEAEKKNAAFREIVSGRYNAAQNTKQQRVAKGSALAMNEGVQSKFDQLNNLESGLDLIAGEEYNNEVEAGLDRKISFIQENQEPLEKIYGLIGKNAGHDVKAKMFAEVAALEDVLQDPFFKKSLEAGDSYVVEERFTTGMANADVYYERTDAAREKRNMDLNTFKGISAEYVWDFNRSLYDYQNEFSTWGQEDAKRHGDWLLDNFKIPYLGLEGQEKWTMKDWAEKASQEWVDSTPYDGKMAPTGGYFLQRYLEEQDGPAFNYPAVGESADGIGSGKENTQAGLYILPDELAKRTLPYQLGLTSTAQPAYVSPEIQQKTESQPTSQTMHYNANLNVSKMEVMDKATVQKVVDEMLVALAATYQVTPQGIPL